MGNIIVAPIFRGFYVVFCPVSSMAVGKSKIDKSLPQDAAAKKARAMARATERHKKRAANPATKKLLKPSAKSVTQGTNPVSKTHKEIQVMKRKGGTVRFARALGKIIKDRKARPSPHNTKLAEGKEAQKPKTGANKFRVCRMRKVYHTQLPMRYAAPKGSAKHVNRPTKLRKSLVPGTVCIILAGRHQSKKCIFLKQLRRSGLLLVTGPHKVNGIPLRRIDQKHVIATSVRVDLGKFKVPGRVDDFFFKNTRGTKRHLTTKANEAVLKEKKDKSKKVQKKHGPSIDRKHVQHALDKSVISALKAHPEQKMLFKYMKRHFTIIGERYPHNMKF